MREFKEHKKPSATASDTFFKARVQPKLQVGQPGDAFEKEADSVADAVVSKSGKNDIQKAGNPEEGKVQKKPVAESISSVQLKELKEEEAPVQKKEDEEQPVMKKEEEDPTLQKKEDEEPVMKKEDEDPALQKKEEEEKPVMKKEDEDPTLQKKEEEEKPVMKKEEEDPTLQKKEEEEKPVMKKEEEDPTLQKKEEEEKPVMKKEEEDKLQKKSTSSSTASPKKSLETRLSSSKGKGSKLGGGVKNEMESGFGSSFEKVNIHTDDQAVKMNQELGAQAFTHGSDIYFNQSKYDPNSIEGKKLLAHELTHTVQQEGMVQKKVQRYMQKNYPWDGIITTRWNAALHSVPGKGNVLADLPNGTRLKVIDHSGNWLKVKVFAGGLNQIGYVSQELVGLDTAKVADKTHFDTYPAVKESSGWLMGEKGVQSTTASNGVELGAASLMNYDVVYLNGGLLDSIKVDNDMLAHENALIKKIKADKRYLKEPFYVSGVESVEFGGKRWSSKTEDWSSLGSSNPIFHSETWGVAGNELTWALRHATVKYWADVSADGSITISYHLNDRLDLSGSKGRSSAYNNLSEGLGFFYHKLAGGNINMQTRAEWITKR